MAPNEDKHSRLPWGIVILLAFQSVIIGALYQNAREALSGAMLALVLLSAVVMWGIGRSLQNSLAGLLMAFLLVFHPLYWHLASQPGLPLWAEFLELVALLCVLGIWHQAGQPQLHLRSLLALFAVLLLTSGLAWLSSPHAGWVTTLLATSGLLLAALLTMKNRQAKPVVSIVHGLVMVVFGIGFPVVCVLLTVPFVESADWLHNQGLASIQQVVPATFSETPTAQKVLEEAYQPQWERDPTPGFNQSELEQWGWPHWGVLVAFMAVGLWRSMRRGWLQWREGEPPLPWVLTLFVVSVVLADGLHPQSVRHAEFLPLASVAVVLSVFGVGDTLWAFGQAIQLPPPGEEEETPSGPKKMPGEPMVPSQPNETENKEMQRPL